MAALWGGLCESAVSLLFLRGSIRTSLDFAGFVLHREFQFFLKTIQGYRKQGLRKSPSPGQTNGKDFFWQG